MIANLNYATWHNSFCASSVRYANCSPAVVPSLPSDTNCWSSGIRSLSLIRRFVFVKDSSKVSAISFSVLFKSPFWSLEPPCLTPQYSFKNCAILAFLMGSFSASPRLSVFSAISKYSASHSIKRGGLY